MTEAEAFLAKADESLASAEDDYAKRRYNSCARSSYYAAYQAAVAALLAHGIRPKAQWRHKFVQAQFAGILVLRRKRYAMKHRDLLSESLKLRNRADYSVVPTSRPDCAPLLERARRVVQDIREQI